MRHYTVGQVQPDLGKDSDLQGPMNKAAGLLPGPDNFGMMFSSHDQDLSYVNAVSPEFPMAFQGQTDKGFTLYFSLDLAGSESGAGKDLADNLETMVRWCRLT